jgi:hypothetical protein
MKRVLILFVLLAAARPARADVTAKERLDSGLRHFAAKEYDAAIADFKAGYALEPRADFLYAWAQAERLRGDCRAATPLYQRYLASGVTAEQAKVAADNLARCHKLVGEEPAAPPPPPPVVVPAPPPPPPLATPAPPAPPPPAPPWYTDTVGDVLLGSGLLAVGVGAVLFATSASAASDAPSAASYGAYADALDGARTQRTAAIVAVGAGGGLIVAGIVHMLMPRAPVEVTASSGGATISSHF